MQPRQLQQIPVTELKGVGAALAEKLHHLSLYTLQDLLFHLPLRYEDRTRLIPMGELRLGSTAVIEGDIISNDLSFGRRRSLKIRIRDGSGQVTLRFFHFSGSMKQQLQPGLRVQAYGEARPGATGLEIYHPEFRVLQADTEKTLLEQALTPVYATTEGLQQKRLRDLIAQALQKMHHYPPAELLPANLLQHFGLVDGQFIDLVSALHFLHHPPPNTNLQPLLAGIHPAQRRLALEELLAQQLGMLLLRQQVRQESALALPPAGSIQQQLLAQLPFQMTDAQQRVVAEISQDLQQPRPMMRLVQGDVGSGKTLVAALACLQALDAGYQAALMAPTELLAEQHCKTLTGWLEPLGFKVALLAARTKGKTRETLLQALGQGDIHLLVGTHALFQEQVAFARLALVVIDEQHRFGVHQRLALRNKGQLGEHLPHQLIMTATPIPRTLAMSCYADLDVSVIDELPPGRQPITTTALPDSRRGEVIERLRQACLQGRQAYWVCTLIEESEALECQAAEATYALLQQSLPELNIALLHGRMKAAEKAAIMAAFYQGQYHLLVATTVIEVGVDVPNASLMVIDNAERLGLAQLHQLRGRVGRGQASSFCVLIYHPPLSAMGRERLQVMRHSQDGFVIAEKDLALRGPGELLGTRQTGEITLRIANLQRDADLLPALKPLAETLLQQAPEQAHLLIKRWRGDSLRFAQV